MLLSKKGLVSRIRTRLYKENKNFLCIITGKTGHGKTYSALRLAEEIDPTFNINRVAFSPEEFFELVTGGRLKRGNVIVFDEAGVGLPNREWWSFSNRAINYILQSFRYRNLVVIFTVPSLYFIDIGARKLFHMYMEVIDVDRKRQAVKVKPFFMDYSSRYDKIYFKYPRMKTENGIVVVSKLAIKKPSPELAKDFEKKRDEWAKLESQKLYGGIKFMKWKMSKKKYKRKDPEIPKDVKVGEVVKPL